MKPAIRLESVNSGYGGPDILKNISFEIPAGCVTGIIGPNGSGKTTLFKTITGLLKTSSGQIFIDGTDSFKIKTGDIARKIAVVSQSIEAINLSARDYAAMGRLPYYTGFQFFETRKDREITGRYMAMTGASSLADKLISTMSGGEKQIVQISRALIQEPEILMLDEPTSHLDIAHQIRILDLIKRLNSKLGVTVIMILHDLNLASEYCDQLIMLDKGSIASAGTPDEVLDYRIIEAVYDTKVIVEKNPLSGKPFVLLITGACLEGNLQKNQRK